MVQLAVNQPVPTQQTVDHLTSVLISDMKRGLLDLPTLPEVALRVHRLVEDEPTSIAQIAMLLSLDPALSARLLQVANSPLYRGSETTENIKMAVTRLGNDVVRNLVTSLVMQQLFHSSFP